MQEHRLALKPGYQLDYFRIESVLGKGGFGITYLAVDLRLGKRVAIKELLPDTIATRVEGYTVVPQSSALGENWQWARERFLEEARVLAGFSHPAIVGVHLLLEAHGTVYMVMDYVEGESYEGRLKRIGREPDQNTLISVMGPILDGLEEVHAKGLMHRDIKPENILINSRGQPVLIDFGSARESVGKTMTMTSIVTHGYSPIEQYQTKGRMGPWTDIYAMGAVMCRAMTGEKPPEAPDRIVEDNFLWLSYREISGFSADFKQAIDWALRVRPEERPQSVGDFGAQLRPDFSLRVAQSRQEASAPPQPETIADYSPSHSEHEMVSEGNHHGRRTAKKGRPKWLIPLIAAAVVALLAASAGAFLVANQRAKRLAQQAAAEEAQKKIQEEALAMQASKEKAEAEQRAARAKKEAEEQVVAEANRKELETPSPTPAFATTESSESGQSNLTDRSDQISSQMAGRFSGNFGFIDMNKVFTSYYKTKKAETRLNDARAQAKADLDGRLEVLKAALEEINRLEATAKRPGISATSREEAVRSRDEKINEVRNLDREIGEFRETREKQLQEQFMRMRGDIVQDIMKVVDSAAPSTHSPPTFFFDASSLAVSQVKFVLLQGPDNLGLSDAITAALNADKQSLGTGETSLNNNMIVGLIDMNKVFTSYHKTKEAETRLNDARAQAKADLDGRLEVLKAALEEINRLKATAKRPGISVTSREEAVRSRDEKINEVRNLDREIGEFRETREKQLQEQFMRMRGDIVQDIVKTVESITSGQSNFVLFDISGLGISQVPALVYVGDHLGRLDNDVIKILNAGGASSSNSSRKTAVDLKIGTVDMNKIFTSLPETKAAESELNSARARAKAEVDRKSKTLDAEETKKLRKTLEDDLQEKFNQMRGRIVSRIREDLASVCKVKGFDLIFDTSALGQSQVRFVLLASGVPDLTNEVTLQSGQ